MVKMKKMLHGGLMRGNFGIWRARKLYPIKIVSCLLIYFGPRILGFAILQQPAATITLKIGTYTKVESVK